MKKLTTLILALLAVAGATAKPTITATKGISAPRVDERIELMSITAKLAGFKEYQIQGVAPAYEADLAAHFAPYKEHPAVLFLQQAKTETGVSYDAIPAMAVYLTDTPTLLPRIPFTAEQPEPRWGVERSEKFVALLRDFYQEAHCKEFFARHDSTFRRVEKAFENVFTAIDTAWFTNFYGEDLNGGMIPIVGMGFGPNNYGGNIIYPDGTEDKFAFMGSWRMDQSGQPNFQKEGFTSTIIHEFNHSFVNPTLDAEPLLKEPGTNLLEAQLNIMQQQAYGDYQTVLNETFVRANTIRYAMAHGADSAAVAQATYYNVDRGFIWMPEAVALLDEYENNRDIYPAFHSFMPRIVEFFNTTAEQIDTIRSRRAAEQEERIAKAPLHVVAIEPFGNGAQDVDPNLKEITIRFDHPLIGRGCAFNPGPGGMDKFFKLVGIKGYSDNNTAITVQVELKPDTEYEFFVLKDFSFVTPDGGRLGANYLVKFRTRSK